jgi:hypothetical protein
MYKGFRKAAIATVLAGGVALGGFATAGTAQASEDTGVTDGSGNTTNDWGDEGTLQKDDVSNAVILWQTVLVADGATFKNSAGAQVSFTENHISGEFDARTVSATKDWQKDRGLTQTGKANGASFSVADNSLGIVNKKGNVAYDGDVDDVTFKRQTVAGFNDQVYSVNFDGSFVRATY